jgi:hypothetical protein
MDGRTKHGKKEGQGTKDGGEGVEEMNEGDEAK